MNSFCGCLRLALMEKFEIDVEVYISKKQEGCAFVFDETFDFLWECKSDAKHTSVLASAKILFPWIPLCTTATKSKFEEALWLYYSY